MANITDWCVVGISKRSSKKNPENFFYVVSCVRENDSLFAGKAECRVFFVNDRGLDKGIKAGSLVSYYGDAKGFGFLRNLGEKPKS